MKRLAGDAGRGGHGAYTAPAPFIKGKTIKQIARARFAEHGPEGAEAGGGLIPARAGGAAATEAGCKSTGRKSMLLPLGSSG
jgi:hypothetical protein